MTPQSTQLEIEFSAAPICGEAVSSTTASPHQNSPSNHVLCTHPRLSLGLDRAHCPDCKAEFQPWSKAYKNALEPQPQKEPEPQQWKPGDRVTILSEPPTVLYQIIKLTDDGHASVESLDGNTATNRRRVALWKLRPCCALPAPTHEQTVAAGVPTDPTHEPECSCVSPSPISTDLTHEHFWVQTYWVRRGNAKHEYYRFCYQPNPRDIGSCVRVHIPGGNVRSLVAIARKAEIESAIAMGKSPLEILETIKSWRGGQQK